MVIHHQTDRARENFPVASFLLPQQARIPILAFYDFVRGADNIADDPTLSSSEKRTALNALHAALTDPTQSAPAWAQAWLSLCHTQQADPIQSQALLHAFLQDATQTRYKDWDELLDYCRHSANPVGRYILATCNESNADLEAADALCTALQLLNHLQDTKDDYQQLDRLYWPTTLLHRHNLCESMLTLDTSTSELTSLKEDILNRIRALLSLSRPLPSHIQSWRLRKELACIWHLADRLHHALAQKDILSQRITLSPMQKLQALCIALL